MATKTALRPETVERLIDEVEEWSSRVHRLRHRLSRVKRESDSYQNLLSELSVELFG